MSNFAFWGLASVNYFLYLSSVKLKQNMNVVLLCRVSTNHQDYHRQIAELTEFSNHQGWKIEKVFANKISGAKKVEERPEIQEMIAYMHEHAIDNVLGNYRYISNDSSETQSEVCLNSHLTF